VLVPLPAPLPHHRTAVALLAAKKFHPPSVGLHRLQAQALGPALAQAQGLVPEPALELQLALAPVPGLALAPALQLSGSIGVRSWPAVQRSRSPGLAPEPVPEQVPERALELAPVLEPELALGLGPQLVLLEQPGAILQWAKLLAYPAAWPAAPPEACLVASQGA